MLKNILIFRSASSIGGAEVYLDHFVTKLQQDVRKVVIITDNANVKKRMKDSKCTIMLKHWFKEPVDKIDKVIFLLLFPYFSLYFFLLLRSYKKNNLCDIVYCTSMNDKIYSFIAARFLRIPIVWIEHGPISPWFGNRYLQLVYRIAAKNVKAIICVSTYTKLDIATFQIEDSKLHIIPNGVDTDLFKPLESKSKSERRKAAHLPDGFLVGYFGRLDTNKGIDILLSIMHNPTVEDKNITLIIIGTGEMKASIEADKGLGKNIFYLGYQTHMENLIPLLDVFLFPTTHAEGLPFALLEALSCGVFIIANKIQELSTTLEENLNSFLIPISDVPSWVTKILFLYNNPEVLEKFSLYCRKDCVERFSLDTMYHSTIQIFENATNG